MSSILDTFINYLIKKKKNNQKNINKMINHIQESSKNFNKQGANKFDLEKNKFALKKKYYELGKYISSQFIKDGISDFSYKEEYLVFNKEIKKIKDYIDSLNRGR